MSITETATEPIWEFRGMVLEVIDGHHDEGIATVMNEAGATIRTAVDKYRVKAGDPVVVTVDFDR